MARTPRRVGAHTSTAGGVDRAAAEALELGCNCFQIFTRSPRMWAAPPLDREAVARLRAARLEHDLRPLVVHGGYLLNLASADPANRAKSVAAFRDEVERALAVGAEYLVFHPGSSKGYESAEPAIAALAAAFAEAVEGVDWDGLEILLENTAGGGSTLGREPAELSRIREAIVAASGVPVGYCLDTAHLHASGFDMATAKGLAATLAAFDAALGLERVRAIHANDSKTALGSRVDRHEHIGQGTIGEEAFRRILRHPKLKEKPFVLETPLGDDGTHRRNVEELKRLIG
jgi:deoxyribonuclease-4